MFIQGLPTFTGNGSRGQPQLKQDLKPIFYNAIRNRQRINRVQHLKDPN